jgi:hypothetical protein
MKINSFSSTLVVRKTVLVPFKPNNIFNTLQLALKVDLTYWQPIRVNILGARLLCNRLDSCYDDHRKLSKNRLERLRKRLQIQKQTVFSI